MKDKMLSADPDLETGMTICLGTEKMLAQHGKLQGKEKTSPVQVILEKIFL